MSVNKKTSKKFFLFIIILAIGSYAVGSYVAKSKYKKVSNTDEMSTVAETNKNTAAKEVEEPNESETSNNGSESKKIETWGPDRILYSWDVRADHPTLNSIYNDPAMGDERNFVRIRKADSDEKFTDNVLAEPGAEYEVQIFFHNNADPVLNDNTGKNFAKSIRLRVDSIVGNITNGQSAQITGRISAENTTPAEVWDTAYIQTERPVSLRYVHGSARIHNGGKLNGELIDDDALFGKYGGTFIGYNQWGLLPGGEKYSGSIIFKIKVDVVGFDMNNSVSKEGENDYKSNIDAVPGETLDFKMHFKNTGTTILKDVVVYDLLGEGLEFVPGTTKIYTPSHPEGTLQSDALFKNGFNIGDYKGGMDATITYKVKVVDDEKLFPRGETVVIENNSAAAIYVGTIQYKAKIRVRRE